MNGKGPAGGADSPKAPANLGTAAPPSAPATARDPDEVRRHEAHLVGQIYHLIEVNQGLEEQLHRLSKLTEITEILRGRRLTRDTFEMRPPSIARERATEAWREVEGALAGVPDGTPGKQALVECLGRVREVPPGIDPDWMSDVKGRLLAAEQALAFLDEQTRELDALRREKDSILDGATRLEQNIEDLWKALNEKTTHIQRLEKQLSRIWESTPYKVWRFARSPLRKEGRRSS